MFLIGVDIQKGMKAVCAVTERRLKHARKTYCLKAVNPVHPADEDTLVAEIESLYKDRGLTSDKRVFSQDRRPSKHLRVPPAVVMRVHPPDIRSIDRLREKGVPVEAIAVHNGINWHKEKYGRICLGNNYFVPENDLITNLFQVWKQGRLHIEKDVPVAGQLISGMERMARGAATPDGNGGEMEKDGCRAIRALSMPVWFSETIRVIRRY